MNGLLAWLSAMAAALGSTGFTPPCTGWHSVSTDSRLEFIVTFEGAPAPGEFHRFDVCMEIEPTRPESGRLEGFVDVTTADMASADLNEAIAEPEWFDSRNFPIARFVSERIEPEGGTAFIAHGMLSLKGRLQKITVPFTWQHADGAPGIAGEARLQRSAFGIGSGEWATGDSIGIEVTVRFDVALERLP